MDTFNRLLNNLKIRILLMISRGVLKSVSDDKNVQLCQVSLLDNELKSDIERTQDYGFTSVPPIGSIATVLFLGGDRSNGIVIKADNNNYRIKNLQNGEVAIYTDEGDKIVFKRGKTIEITTTTLKITGDVEVSGKVDVVGNITSAAEVSDLTGTMTVIRSVYDNATHNPTTLEHIEKMGA